MKKMNLCNLYGKPIILQQITKGLFDESGEDEVGRQ
jgi:hypothetical protein